MANDRQLLQKLEDTLLHELSNASGNILDNQVSPTSREVTSSVITWLSHKQKHWLPGKQWEQKNPALGFCNFVAMTLP
jgi:hypothetical protein